MPMTRWARDRRRPARRSTFCGLALKNFVTFSAGACADFAEDAARRLLSSGLLAFPVVDNGNRVVGIFTHDEAAEQLLERLRAERTTAVTSSPLPPAV